MSSWWTVVSLLAAAALEVGGDASLRQGLLGRGAAWLVTGSGLLLLYGFVVNANRSIELGRLLGAYIAVFFVVAQIVGFALFGERPAPATVLGGLLIVAGGLVVQLAG